ncbi:type II toxin-antitoxin system Phd/YefM family antitoxin [Rhodococcoides yunnanense]|uniref:type II toxin-antitoxin system Phd/YefM family antitoxin n=1 Tax=Rhodococcoides yunnanense TaxID=278209 RepID=UPI00093270F6|nr:type II toxin-antitoxin system prevent-host-death family antitoxin [Rhodococcus yunnanensis]
MTEVGIRALKQNASAVVAEAAAGQSVTITDHGRPVARLTSIPSSPLGELIATGAMRPARRDLNELAEPLPGPNLSSELSEIRGSERF